MNTQSDQRDYLSAPDAARVAGVARVTMSAWLRCYEGLGRRVAGRWRVDPAALAKMLAGEQLPRRAEGGAARG